MDIGNLFKDLIFDYTLRTVALGSSVLGIVSGALGTYAVLRKQSLLGDAISHAALPGIVLAFLLTSSKAPLIILMGAALAGWLATLAIIAIIKNTPLKEDTALGLVLSVFFGFGLVLLTFIQKRPDATQAGLDKFLFGQAATLLERDVLTMGIMGIIVILTTLLFWKEFKLFSFDPDFASSQGFPIRFLEILVTSLLVIAIVLGLQTVGVVLMSAMVVAPAAAARQWTNRLGPMMLLSAAFGAISGISGAMISSLTTRLPTGPTIVLCVSAIVVLSLLFAPARGLLWNREKQHRPLQLESVLLNLYALAQQHQTPGHGHAAPVLRTMGSAKGSTLRSLKALEARGWVHQIEPGRWALTSAGLIRAEELETEV